MKVTRRDTTKLLAGLAALGIAPLSMRAVANTGESVSFVVGFPPGGGPDTLARTIADRLQPLGWQAIVENRTGASGQIAVDYVRRGGRNDAIALITPIEILTLLPHVYKDVRFNPFDDFIPVAGLSESPYGLAVSPNLGVNSLEDLIAWFKANPNEASYATPGEGTPQHFLGEILSRDAGLNLLHVPYRGGPPAIADVMGGQIPCVITSYGALAAHQQSGNLKVLAYTASRPSSVIPGSIPTFIQLGYPNIRADGSYLAVCSKEVNPDFANSLGDVLTGLAETDAYKEALAKLGQEALVIPRSEVAQHMRESYDYWGDVVASTGFQPI